MNNTVNPNWVLMFERGSAAPMCDSWLAAPEHGHGEKSAAAVRFTQRPTTAHYACLDRRRGRTNDLIERTASGLARSTAGERLNSHNNSDGEGGPFMML